MNIKTIVMLIGLACVAAGPARAQSVAAEETELEGEQVSAPLSDMEMRTYKQILDMIDQGGPVPSFMLNWAKARINVYVRAALTPLINQVVEDYIRMGMTTPARAPLVFDELMSKFEPNMRVELAAKFQKSENR